MRWRLLLLGLAIGATAADAAPLRVLALRTDAFFYEKDGRPAGVEYEILAYFARTRADELVVEWATTFRELLARIERGEADVAAGTITITAERARRMDFSTPYFPVQVAVAVRADDGAQSVRDLAGSRVGAFADTTAEAALRDVEGVAIVAGASLGEMLDAVEGGALRAAAADSSALIPALENRPGLRLAFLLGEEQAFGFALPAGSPLTQPLSETIRRLKESGIYYRIVGEHLGEKASAIVRAAKRH